MEVYRHLNKESKTIEAQWQTDIRNRLLNGLLPVVDVPKIKPTCAKVYLSSTFTDTACEREYLQRDTFPKLREYCRAAHDIEFHVVDLRTGVGRQARQALPSVLQTGLFELEECKRDSAGPYHLFLLGERYCNEAVPPSELSVQSLDCRIAALRTAGHDCSILEKHYKKDENCLPPVYKLQPILISTDKWVTTERNITDLLTLSSTLLEDEPWSNPTPDIKLEVESAVLSRKRQKTRDDCCIVIMRQIEDINDRLDRKNASKFIDIMPATNELDFEAVNALECLKHKIESNLTKNNIFRFKVKWSEPSGISTISHCDYLTDMGNTVYEQIRRHVDVNMIEWDQYPSCTLYTEVQQHWLHTQQLITSFYEQGQALAEMSKFLKSKSTQPLIIHGMEGCGKSALISKTAALLKERSGSDRIIIRYLGKTPNSADVRQLVTSLVEQIGEVFDMPYRPPSSYLEAKTTLRSMLMNGHSNFTLVILLDGIDKLKTDSNEQIDWLPLQLAPNIKMIITSTDNDPKSTTDRLMKRYLHQSSFLKVNNMLPETCEWILQKRLSEVNRKVTHDQLNTVLKGLRECPYPLYVELVFEVIRHWTSDTVPVLPTSIPTVIDLIIDRLEKRHGVTISRSILSYITASQHGISEPELEDILSLDDQVLSEVLSEVDQSAAHIRVPNLIWSKMKYDIKPFIECWKIDGFNVVTWRYRQFAERVRNRYFSAEYEESVHSIMADFYLGKWSYISEKPNSFSRRSNDCNTPSSECLTDSTPKSSRRDVITQPLVVNAHGVLKRYNIRKLNELPYHLLKSNRTQQLKQLVMFNYDWIQTTLCCLTIEQLLDHLSLLDDLECRFVRDAVKGIVVNSDPDKIGIELTGRLLPYYSEHANIKSLIDQCDLKSLQYASLVPVGQLYTCPGTFLQHHINCERTLTETCQFASINKDGCPYFVVKDRNRTSAEMINALNHEIITFDNLPMNSDVYVTPSSKILLTKRGSNVEVYQIDSQQRISTIKTEPGQISCHYTSDHYFAFSHLNKAGLYLIDFHYPSILHKFTYQTTAVCLNADSSLIVLNNGHNILVYEIPLLKICRTIETEDLSKKILFVNDQNKFVVFSSSYFVKMYTLNRTSRSHQSHTLFHEPTTLDIKLNSAHTVLLIHTCKSVVLMSTRTYENLCTISDLSHPTSQFDITSAHFLQCGEKVFITREQAVGVFDVKSGRKIREADVPHPSDIREGVVLPSSNIAATVLYNGMIQIWNFENTSENNRMVNNYFAGPADSFDVSDDCSLVAVCCKQYPVAQVISTHTGNQIKSLYDSFAAGSQPLEVIISPGGRRVVTRCLNETDCNWAELKSDYIWDVNTGRVSHFFVDNMDVLFSDDDSVIVSVSCISYTEADPSNKMFQAHCYRMNGEESIEHKTVYPDGDIVGNSLVYSDNNWLLSLIQPCVKTKFSGLVMQQRVDEIQLYIFDLFTSSARDRSMIECKTLSGEDHSYFIDLRPSTEPYQIILMYSTGKLPPYGKHGRVDRSHHMNKSLLIYDLIEKVVVRDIKSYADHQVSPEKMLLSKNHSLFIHNMTVYDSQSERRQLKPKFSYTDQISPQLVLDGNYMLLVSDCLSKVYLINTRNAETKSHLLLYGEAVGLRVGNDDRTVFVSTRDGRVLMLMVILESCDPVTLLIKNHPSRNQTAVDL